MEPLKLTEPHHMFHGTLGFRGTPVEEHWSTCSLLDGDLLNLWQYGLLTSLMKELNSC